MAPDTPVIDLDGVIARLAAAAAADQRVAILRALPRDMNLDAGGLWALAERIKDEADQARYQDTTLSLRWSDDVVALGQGANAPTVTALGRMAAGLTLYEQGRYHDSLATFDDASAIFEQHGHEAGWARTQIGRTATCMALARFDEALQRAERARAIFVRLGDQRRAAIIDNNLALLLERMNRPAEALRYSAQALAAYRGGTASKDAIDALSNHALLLWRLGRAREALTLHQEARAGYMGLGAVVSAAQEDLNIGAAHLALGHYAEASSTLALARHNLLAVRLPNIAAFAGLYLAECFVRVGRFHDAVEMAAATRTECAAYGDAVQVVQAVTWQASAYAGLHQYDAALRTFDAVSDLLRTQHGLAAYQPITNISRAHLLLHMGRAAEAKDLVAAAIPSLQAAGLLAEVAAAQVLLGEALLAQGRPRQALQAIGDALTVAEREGLDLLLAHALHLRGRIELRQGDASRASTTLSAAVRYLDRVHSRVAWDDHATFAGTAVDIYADAMALALRRAQPALALRYAERARARALAVHLRAGIDVRPRARDERSRTLVDELAALRDRHAWLNAPRRLEPSAQEAPLAAVRWTAEPVLDSTTRTEAAAIERRMAEIWRELQAANPAYRGEAAALDVVAADATDAADDETAAQRWAQDVQAALHADDAALLHADDAALLHADDAALLEYAAIGDDLVLFVLRGGALRAVRLDGAAAELPRLMSLLRLNVERSAHAAGGGGGVAPALASNARGILHRLYGVLLAPAAPLLDGATRLVIVPQGAGHHVPFHALHDGTRYLIEQYEVSYIPCAGLVEHVAARHRRLCENGRVSGRGALALACSGAGALPQVGAEGRAVIAALGGRLLRDDEATVSALRAQAGDCAVLHLAAHAVFRPDEPLFSALHLGDGRFSTLDVFDLELECSLVTLSACETALGTTGAGDELMGLSRAFLYAGAPSLVLSLWKVEDRSTATLMQAFYGALRQGRSKAAALRHAQLALLRSTASGDYSAPYFWAPFTLIGHAGPLPDASADSGQATWA